MNKDNLILDNVEKDMDVYDQDGNHIGDVDFVHFGEGHDAAGISDATVQDDSTLEDMIKSAFAPDKDVPEDLRGKLYRHGFARVNALGDDYFFIPEHIDRIEDDEVYLNVDKEGMLRI